MRAKVHAKSRFLSAFSPRHVRTCAFLAVAVFLAAANCTFAQTTQPMVAVHDSEFTRALETMPASGATPTGAGTTGKQWWPTDWHYFVMPEAVKESLRSDGTPFTVVGDSNVAAGLLLTNGTPRYPIVISLAAEAIRDDEIAAFTNYVAAGGFLLVGSSSFTRTTNGLARGDFAFANELGVHASSSTLNNWAQNNFFSKTNQPAHRLISHIPTGQMTWRMPSASEEIPWGLSPSHQFLAPHDIWRVQTTTATVLAQGDASPLLTIKSYGKGYFIYCSAFQPLIGHSGFAPGMYAYVIFRRAIEWSFESAQLPVPKLSPWPYQYDAAWMIRHDLENFTNEIAGLEASAQVEFTNGARGDYYFCTGTLRDDASPTYNTNNLVASLRRAVTNYGATIGPHNGGLKNPNNPALVRGDYDYWHWGPDEALDVTPAGYASGKAYALASLSTSFNDIESWMKGITNGLRSWVGCYFNATREDSYDIQSQLGVKIAGEQKLTPFPHWTLSTGTAGKKYSLLSEPVSDWFVNGQVAQSLEPWHSPGIQTSQTLHEAIDFYYGLGALINFYSHTLSTGLGDAGQLVPDYINYSLNTNFHPRIWSANAASVYQWWLARSNAQVNFSFATNGYQSLVNLSVRGATDPNTAVEILLPGTNQICTVQVWTNGNLAAANSYRVNGQLIKLRVGNSVTNAIVSYYPMGQSSAIFTQNFDSTTAPALPAGWTTSASGVQTPWITQASGSDTAPNAAVSADPANIGINELVSPAINLPGGSAQLSFRHSYDLETGAGSDGFDGGVLEIKVGTNAFTDVITAGGSFVSGGYNSIIDTQWGNPLAGRPAWSGTSAGYITTLVNLPAVTSQPIQLRWRCGTDNSNGKTGWRIDSIAINARACLCCNGTANTPPILPAQADRTIAAQTPLVVNNTASDLDLPPQLLMYQLVSPPAGASMDAGGVINWTPSAAQALTTNVMTTVVTDSGTPALSATNSFLVIVLNTNTPPAITAQPVSATNNVGTTASFSVTATGTSPNYQWIKNGSIVLANGGNVSGATAATLTLASVTSGDAGSYAVSVSNAAGNVISSAATLTIINTNTSGGQLFGDDFTRGTNPGPLAPWLIQSGSWNVANGTLNTATTSSQGYGYAYLTNSWTNYSVQARIRFSSTSSYGGGIGARVNPITGAHYAAWIYPENSGGGPSVLRIIKFQEWIAFEYTNITEQPMALVNLPSVGTNWHTLNLSVQGNQISAFYDGNLAATATDVESNPFATGAISVDTFSDSTAYSMSVDDVAVTPLPSVLMAVNDLYLMKQGGTLNVPAAGILINDTPGALTNLSAVRVSGPSRGNLTFNANGGFTYVPTNNFTGIDSFTYLATDGVNNSTPATVAIDVAPATNVFYENFSRTGTGNPYAPWVIGLGEWNLTNGVLQGASTITDNYSDTYIPTDLTDFSIQAKIQLPAGAWAGGLSGRVDPASGARYVANIYPEGSPLGPTPALRLIKFHSWNTWSSSFTPMALVNLPPVGTAAHTLRLTFQGNQISVYFDGVQVVSMADNLVDGLPAYTHGAFGAHMYMYAPDVVTFDDLYVASQATSTNNTAPVLPVQINRTIAESTSLVVTNTATDADVPANSLTYSLLTSPGGANISAAGIISWTPTESQGPGVYTLTTRVADNGSPSLSATNSFTVTVTEVNSAPVLPVQTNRTLLNQMTLLVTNTATDSDLPANVLVYSLVNPPTGAAIDTNGLISWAPTAAQTPSTAVMTTIVTDNGTPARSATNSFTVSVVDTNQVVSLFSDSFGRTAIAPWVSQSGTWKISGGILSGSAKNQNYGFVYLTNNWTNFSVEAQLRFATNAYAGGVGGYLNRSTGARYAAWIFPEASAGGSNVVRLFKFNGWKTYSYTNVSSVPMKQASLPGVGTNWHNLKLAFSGSQIAVYYDTNLVINTTDEEANHYTSGGISIDLRTSTSSDLVSVDSVLVNSIPVGVTLGRTSLAQQIILPTNPVILSVAMQEGAATVTWSALPGKVYRLQYSEDPATAEWIDATDDILATDSTITATNTVGDSAKRFYRIVQLP